MGCEPRTSGSELPDLVVAAAADQPSRAPRTPLNTAEPAAYVYIGNAEATFTAPAGTLTSKAHRKASAAGRILSSESTAPQKPQFEEESF